VWVLAYVHVSKYSVGYGLVYWSNNQVLKMVEEKSCMTHRISRRRKVWISYILRRGALMSAKGNLGQP